MSFPKLNWSHTEAKNSFNLKAISFESVYVWLFIKISSGNSFFAEFALLFSDRKCFHIFHVSF